MPPIVLARVIHVLSIVLWIGGVAFVTTVLLPAIWKLTSGDARIELFERLESRFAMQAKVTTVLAGASGLYMIYAMGAWSRYLDPAYWWMHLMTFVWFVFTLVLFVFEPLFLHRWFIGSAKQDSDRAFRLLQRGHWVLLTLSIVAIVGAIAGSRGYLRV